MTNESSGDPFRSAAAGLSRRDFIVRVGGVALAAASIPVGLELLAACGTGGSSSSSTAKQGGSIVEGNVADPQTFNPLVAQDFTGYIVSGLLFDGLLTVDRSGQLQPALAESLPKVSSDSLTFTFTLRKDLKWSDGQPLTADDVVFTYELMSAPQFSTFNSAYGGDLRAKLESVTATDPTTIQFKTKDVFAPFPVTFCTLGIVPKHVLSGLTGDQLNTSDFNTGPKVSNGIFKFDSWNKGASVNFVRNPNYWNGPSNIDKYALKIIADPVGIVQQLKTGEVDIGPVDASQFSNLESASNVGLTIFPSLTVEVATFQLNPAVPSSKFFGDKKVRQALIWALDRQAIVDSVFFKKGGSFTNSPEPTGTWAHTDDVTPKYTSDPQKASQMLDAAGWVKNSSGIREKNGVQMQFTILTKTGSTLVPAIQAMADQWKQIGVIATPSPVTIGVIINQLFSKRSFDMILIGNSLLSADPDMAAYYHSRNTAPGGLNGGNYKNPEMDAVLDEADATLDHTKRQQLYARFQNIFADDPPGIPVVSLAAAYGVSKRVKNFSISTYNQYKPRPFMHDVYVTDGK